MGKESRVPSGGLADNVPHAVVVMPTDTPPCPLVHGFHVTVAPGTKLESGPATLHLCNDTLVLAKDVPPAVMGQWKLSDLRRYGAVPSGFIFEGGTRCGYCKYAGHRAQPCWWVLAPSPLPAACSLLGAWPLGLKWPHVVYRLGKLHVPYVPRTPSLPTQPNPSLCLHLP